jgi:antitoxin VapB
MVLHVRDEQVDALARELARRRGVSITEAVREAISEALAHEDGKSSLWARTADIRAKVAAFPRTGLAADKAFYDSLSGQEND